MEDLASFFWYASPDQFDTRVLDEIDPSIDPSIPQIEKTFVDFDIRNGRMKHRWVPKSRAEAIRYLLYHEDAAGLRKASDKYYVVEIHLEEPLENLTEKYEKAVPVGFRGAVIPVPFTMSVVAGTRRDLSPKFTYSAQKLISLEGDKEVSSIGMGVMFQRKSEICQWLK